MADAPPWASDRTDWPKGPWDDEPDDFVAWHAEAGDVPLVALRNDFGAWCGYAGVRRDHPLFRVPRGELTNLPSHAGITYANDSLAVFVDPVLTLRFGAAPIWWIGFDCAHGNDVVPCFHALLSRHVPGMLGERSGYAYRTLPYVRERCEALARALVEIVRGVDRARGVS